MTPPSPPPLTDHELLLLQLLQNAFSKLVTARVAAGIPVPDLPGYELTPDVYMMFALRVRGHIFDTGSLQEMIEAIPIERETQIAEAAAAANAPAPTITQAHIDAWEKDWHIASRKGLVGRIDMSPIEAFHHEKSQRSITGDVVFGPNRLGQILVRDLEGLHLVRYNRSENGNRLPPKMALVARADGKPL